MINFKNLVREYSVYLILERELSQDFYSLRFFSNFNQAFTLIQG